MPEARRPANSSGRSLREIDNLVTGVMMGVELPLTVRILGLGGPDPVAMSVPGLGQVWPAQVPLVPVHYEPAATGRLQRQKSLEKLQIADLARGIPTAYMAETRAPAFQLACPAADHDLAEA